MRILRLGTASTSVRAWKQFLQREELLTRDAPVTRHFDAATEAATVAFQDRENLSVDPGVVGPKTVAAAQAHGFVPPPEIFEIGPDRGKSLRESRPYFLVPLDDPSQTDDVRERIVEWVAALEAQITDIFVISHGWHRNFFDAVSAYDRLTSRLALLEHRKRIRPKNEFVPLFLSVHWHSDPGEDNWTDPAGRRDKASFLAKVNEIFAAKKPGSRCVVNDFEDIFELFAKMSAPGVRAISSPTLWAMQERLSDILDDYDFADMPPAAEGDRDATPAEKVVAVWKCYHESQPKRVLVDQQAPPGNIMSFGRAVQTLVNYVLGAVAVTVLLGLGWKLLLWLWQLFLRTPVGEAFLRALRTLLSGGLTSWIGVYTVLMLLAWIYLRYRDARRPDERQRGVEGAQAGGGPLATEDEEGRPLTRGATGFPLFALLSFAILEFPVLLLTIPCLIATYFAGCLMNGRFLFDERFGRRTDDLGLSETDLEPIPIG